MTTVLLSMQYTEKSLDMSFCQRGCMANILHHLNNINKMETSVITTALFDLDGVIFNTESQYTEFWGSQCRLYHPEVAGLEHRIKGQTLIQILNHYFGDVKSEHNKIIARLNDFERDMKYEYVPGLITFLSDLRLNGVHTAVVTSSNIAKMNVVYNVHAEFKNLFDAVLTSEDFSASKPNPDCYLKGAARFGEKDVRRCVVFEDSFNGLRSGRNAGMHVVGLSTTNPADAIKPLSDIVIPNFTDYDYKKLIVKLASL